MVKLKEHLRKHKWCIYIGLNLIIHGITTIIFWPSAFNFLINCERKLSPNWQYYDSWEKSPIPIIFKAYFFNWTNPEDIRNPNIKPRFEEVGPYIFTQTKEKIDIRWNDGNSTVTYKLVKRWYFDEEATNGTLQDKIVTIDPIARSAAYHARNWGYFAKKGISISLSNFSPSISTVKTVDELLFTGYDDFIMNVARHTASISGIPTPPEKFGFYYGRNNSYELEGDFNMATGKGDDEIGMLVNWRYSNATGVFPGKCSDVRGYPSGELLPHNWKKDYINIFSAEQARIFKMDLEEHVEFEGIKANKFTLGINSLDNGTTIPENKCFCIGDCPPSGALNGTMRMSGAPLFFTPPHFYKADPYYLNMVEGLHPEKDKHELYVTFEPITGIPIDGAMRIQINMLLEPDPYISMYRDVPKIFIPMVWIEEYGIIDDYWKDILKSLMRITVYAYCYGTIVMIVGTCFTAAALMKPLIEIFKQHVLKPGHPGLKEEVPLNSEVPERSA